MTIQRLINRACGIILIGAAIGLPSSASAQPFEGTIYLDVSTHGMTTYDSLFGLKPTNTKSQIVISFKGQKFFIRFQDTLEMYGDHAAQRLVVKKNDAKNGVEMYLVDEAYLRQEYADDSTTVLATGKKRSISGLACECFTISSDLCGESDWWMTQGLPKSLRGPVLAAFWHSSVTAKAVGRNNYFGNPQLEYLLSRGFIPVEMDTKFDGKITSIMIFRKFEEKKLDDSAISVPSDVELIVIPKPKD